MEKNRKEYRWKEKKKRIDLKSINYFYILFYINFLYKN